MKIAVYTICKNEEHNARRWLSTTKDADLRVIVDTGSTDLTLHRLSINSVSVVTGSISIEPFRFDDARNAALALVPPDMDVCVSLDMDEVLSPNWRSVIEHQWGELQSCKAAWFDFNYGGTSFLQNTRIHSRHGWRWKYPYHEGIYPNMEGPASVALSGLTITHKPPKWKARPNIALRNLAWGLFENPGDLRMLHYYGRELLWNGYFKEAAEKFVEYFDRGGDHDKAAVEQYLREAHRGLQPETK